MEIKMNKEIRDYQESMFFGLNMRQFICSLLAVLTAVGIYFGMRDLAGEEVTGWLCMAGAAPFAACGFFKYHGMTAEQFLWALIKSEILYPKRLLYKPEDLYYACMEEAILQGEKAGKNVSIQQDEKRQKKLRKKQRQTKQRVKKRRKQKDAGGKRAAGKEGNISSQRRTINENRRRDVSD